MSFGFIRLPPPPPLASYVESLWYARGQVPYRRERILPAGGAVLIVNLGDPFALATATDGDRPAVRRQAWVCGPQQSYLVNAPLGGTHVMGAGIRPGGLGPLLGLPAGELAGQVVPLDCLWPGRVASLRDRIGEARSPTIKLALLASALRDRLAAPANGHLLVRRALARLEGGGPVRIEEVCAELDVSRKHLSALFRRHVGTAPKIYARLRRFNRALAVLARTDDDRADLAGLAQDWGYCDQPHFNREFAEFAGLSPTRYLFARQRHLGPAAATEPSVFVPID